MKVRWNRKGIRGVEVMRRRVGGDEEERKYDHVIGVHQGNKRVHEKRNENSSF